MPLFKNRSFLVKMVKDEETDQENTVEVDIDEIRDHFKRNRNTYIAIAGGLTVASGVYLAMRSGYISTPSFPGLAGDNTIAKASNNGLFQLNPVSVVNQTVVKEINRQGPPSYIVANARTGEQFMSQSRAAKLCGYADSQLSKHLRTGSPLPDGEEFKRVGLRINSQD
jgi:hypothetical protein